MEKNLLDVATLQRARENNLRNKHLLIQWHLEYFFRWLCEKYVFHCLGYARICYSFRLQNRKKSNRKLKCFLSTNRACFPNLQNLSTSQCVWWWIKLFKINHLPIGKNLHTMHKHNGTDGLYERHEKACATCATSVQGSCVCGRASNQFYAASTSFFSLTLSICINLMRTSHFRYTAGVIPFFCSPDQCRNERERETRPFDNAIPSLNHIVLPHSLSTVQSKSEQHR